MRPSLEPLDRVALEFEAAHDWVISGQLRRLFDEDMDMEATLERMRRLTAEGLVSSSPRLRIQRGAYRITRTGLDRVGSELPEPASAPDLRHYWRDFTLGWLWVAVKCGLWGPVDAVFSRREMRAVDQGVVDASLARADLSPALRAKLEQPGFAMDTGAGSLRYPGLALVVPQGRITMEVLLTAPSHRWLDRVLAGYANKPQVIVGMLLSPSAAVSQQLRTAVERHGLADRMRVQRSVLQRDSE
jgi:hypothetical protein